MGRKLKNGRNMFYYGQLDFTKMDDAKVIGNIFDNPDELPKLRFKKGEKNEQAAGNEGRKDGEENLMISAKEAKQWADRYASKELDRINKIVSDAAQEGKYSVYEEGNLQESTKRELERLGYKVEAGSQFNDLYFMISWEECMGK